MTDSASASPQVPAETDAAVSAWMGARGWRVAPARWYLDPDGGFHIWQEDTPRVGGSHALWVTESIARRLSAEQLVAVLNREDVGEEIRISRKIRIEQRGDEYRVSVVSRSSGEWNRAE